ncbi:low-density lipoprotein receptor-related protein 4 isoform X1 [Euwallacea fornicatus]|uniref:low-density lipoprotein receptor-related protein 4 isoform X1 n=1 Tax=Euwallacea fornicatus TaxID=995702 RepID=UPI00338FD9B8
MLIRRLFDHPEALLVIAISCISSAVCTSQKPTTTKNSTRAVYFQPAFPVSRSFKASATVRSTTKKPIISTGQRYYGVRTTIKPQESRAIYHHYLDPLVRFPMSFPISFVPQHPYLNNYEKILEGYDETYERPVQNRGGGLLNPWSLPGSNQRDIVEGRGYLFPDDPANEDIPPVPTCSNRCRNGMFMCHSNCTCVSKEYRCDGRSQCKEGEDEELCEGQPSGHDHTFIKCDEAKNLILCPKTQRCISKDWLCDGDNDCEDYSDETRCGFLHNCTGDQFQCDNGLCVPKTWVCDNDNDCRDRSDEINCTNSRCRPGEFECADGSCISSNWKCDRHLDCIDGSDERQCDINPSRCNDNEYECNNRNCIKFDFKCDGDGDCEDWSDEINCPMNYGECTSGEYRCQSGECIPKRWLCDYQKDCPNEEDEADCKPSFNTTCNTDEFACKKGQCILNTWVCDGAADCSEGEDEQNCDISCDEGNFPCSGPGEGNTKTVYCLRMKHRCDGQKDCPKGDDEVNCPMKRDCEPDTKCEQRCVTYPDGTRGCACYTGYKLNTTNNITCVDIDECLYATNPVCSQTCNNTLGSFKCGCMTGYILRPDLRTCKAVGASPTLLFANRIDIRQMSLSNSRYSLILRGLHNAISLDYHYNKQLIFWSDVSTDKIKRAAVNGTEVTTIVSSGLESPGGIAVDWTHNLLFWTDSGTKRVEVANLDGTHRAIIVANELDKPRAIVVHPGEAFLFWTDWGPNPKIERSEIDGSNRKSIITESVFWPNGLTLDYTDNQLYWADAKHNVIEAAQLDGSKRRKIVTKGLPHPFAITIFEDAIFWTDWHTKSIAKANKLTGAGYRALHSYLHFPMDIHSFHPQRQPKFKNRCGVSNGGCQHLCLPNRKSYSCACRMGQKLRNDMKTCLKPEKFLMFAKKKDIRIKHLDGKLMNSMQGSSEKQYETVLPLEGIKNAVAVAWDSKSNYIYWTDLALKSINRAYWNGSDHQVILHTNIESPKGLAFDWISDKIYWTDSVVSRIEVAKADGSMRSLIIWEDVDQPGDIVVDAPSGLMFWAELGDKKRIEKANMDGTSRVTLVSTNISEPSGLAIDHTTSKLYWTDSKYLTISLINYDGTGRKILLVEPSGTWPYGLDIFENYIYWTDPRNKFIEKINKLTGEDRSIVLRNVPDSMGIKVFHRFRKNVVSSCNNGNNGGCSHLCLLKPKGHSCACPTGIKLMNDKKTCTSGPLNYLILAHRLDIRLISLDVPYMADVVLPFKHLKMTTTVDVDRKTGEIYWADVSESSIQKSTPNGTHKEVIITREIETPDGIAVDSTGRKIYWTDYERKSIEVAELDGTHRKVLFNKDIFNPRAITLHYHHGLMFWSDWGQTAKIEKAHMDGTNRKALIVDEIMWPNGLAIDRPEGRLYWNDAKRHTIESCNLDGENRKLILAEIKHPYGLVVVGNHIYWTDWKTQALHRADKETGEGPTEIISGLEGLMDVRSVQNDNIAENACGENNGGCSHLCLRNPKGYTCACPTGLAKSKTHPKQCDQVPQTYLLVASRYSISQISLDTADGWDVSLPVKDNLGNVLDIDFHYRKNLVFYADIGRNVIKSVNIYNMSDVRTIVSDNLTSPDGITVDWLAGNIYWTNTGNKKIEVARLDGSSRKTVVSKLGDPRSVVCNPKAGYLFWSDWDQNNPRIERSHLNGSHRRTIISEGLTFPIGLAIDFALRRLYWIDAKLNVEKIESSDFNGYHRLALPIDSSEEKAHPFSLSQYREWLFWTDWDQRCVMRAEKINGNGRTIIRSMHAVMGITMVTEERQPFWNPCAVNNGNCSHLCFYKKGGYTCGCPDEHAPSCSTTPRGRVSNVCPEGKGFDCGTSGEADYDDYELFGFGGPFETNHDVPVASDHSTFYIITLVPMLAIVITSVAVVAYILIKKGKKNYIDGASRSFSNPNYYSNDPNAPQNHQPDRKQFIWKRLKYDKSQERVYEETVVASPEVTSLIPTILTPCSSNCEVVTPEMERSPSVTPLHKVDIQ